MTYDLRALRKSQKMNQKQLADLCGLSVSRIRMVERGFEQLDAAEAGAVAKAVGQDTEAIAAQFSQQGVKTPGEGYTTFKVVGSKVNDRNLTVPSGRTRVLDLFCGCGGLSRGFEQTGKFVVTAGVDLLPDRIETFRLNHPYAATVQGDISRVDRATLKQIAADPEVIIGGPPCQGFSSIRPFRTLTEGDPRNSLIEEFVLTVSEIRPRWFVFENVVGLLSHAKGSTFQSLLESFEDVGYSADWRVINVAQFGVPQARERLVIVGSRDGQAFTWPAPTHNFAGRSMAGRRAKRLLTDPLFEGLLQPAVTVMDAIGDLPAVAHGCKATEYDDSLVGSDYSRMIRNGASRLTMHEATKHNDKMLEIIRVAGTTRASLPAGMTSSGFSSCYSRLEADRPSTTITVNFVHPASNRCIHPVQDRALTPREGARLQGFEDTFQFAGSRAQIVKQIGNAVPPILGRVIAESLAESDYCRAAA